MHVLFAAVLCVRGEFSGITGAIERITVVVDHTRRNKGDKHSPRGEGGKETPCDWTLAVGEIGN